MGEQSRDREEMRDREMGEIRDMGEIEPAVEQAEGWPRFYVVVAGPLLLHDRINSGQVLLTVPAGYLLMVDALTEKYEKDLSTNPALRDALDELIALRPDPPPRLHLATGCSAAMGMHLGSYSAEALPTTRPHRLLRRDVEAPRAEVDTIGREQLE